MKYGCRISKVRLKSGGATVSIIPESNHNFSRIDMGWGELVFRAYDGQEVTSESMVYMLEIAKNMIMFKGRDK